VKLRSSTNTDPYWKEFFKKYGIKIPESVDEEE
jgi:hypothetical protein